MKKTLAKWIFTFIGIITSQILLSSFQTKNTDLKHGLKKNQHNKPNIIFLLTDDQRWDALGAMGNTIIQTPNMNKLATAGILFQNAYVTTSICSVAAPVY